MKVTAWLLSAAALCISASAGADDGPFLWQGMVSQFATDFSESAAQCRVLAAANPDDRFTDDVAKESCPELQRQLQAGECVAVSIDMRNIQHSLMAQRPWGKGTAITARQNAVVDLPFRPEALECRIGRIDDEVVLLATVYVGTQPNGEQACYNVALDVVPILVPDQAEEEEEALPVTFGEGAVSRPQYMPRRLLPLDYCVPDEVRRMLDRRRW